MICTLLLNRGAAGVRSPIGALLGFHGGQHSDPHSTKSPNRRRISVGAIPCGCPRSGQAQGVAPTRHDLVKGVRTARNLRRFQTELVLDTEIRPVSRCGKPGGFRGLRAMTFLFCRRLVRHLRRYLGYYTDPSKNVWQLCQERVDEKQQPAQTRTPAGTIALAGRETRW